LVIGVRKNFSATGRGQRKLPSLRNAKWAAKFGRTLATRLGYPLFNGTGVDERKIDLPLEQGISIVVGKFRNGTKGHHQKKDHQEGIWTRMRYARLDLEWRDTYSNWLARPQGTLQEKGCKRKKRNFTRASGGNKFPPKEKKFSLWKSRTPASLKKKNTY